MAMQNPPPGIRASRMVRRASTGFAKNIVPNRENAMSKRPLIHADSASPTRKRAFAIPARTASFRASSTKRSAASIPTASASLARLSPARDAHSPEVNGVDATRLVRS
jgi:hypothetical protein